MRLVKRLAVLALPCVLIAGSLGSVLASQACRHMAMHHALPHGAPADSPCWCDEMTGGGIPLQPVVEALPALTPAVMPPVQQAVVPVYRVVVFPDSPRFAPTPPPPNGRTA
jgi:hypothetical protein